MAHAGIQKTISRIQFTWNWPDLTTDVRRLIKPREVCQVAKNGSTQATKARQRLFVGWPRQWVTIDLVGQMPETDRKNNQF